MRYIFSILLLLLVHCIIPNECRFASEVSTITFETKFNDDYNKNIGCKVSLNKDLDQHQPLFVVPGSDRFVSPIANTTDVQFITGEQVELHCSHGFLVSDATTMIATCDGKDGFIHRGKVYDISHLTCRDPVFHTASLIGKQCFNNATLIKVGFDLGTKCLNLYEVCFDARTLQSHYVKYSLAPWNIKHERAKRDHFLQGDFFPDMEMAEIYSFDMQHATLALILGSVDRADALLNRRKDIFLAKGQLAAQADFVFGTHQAATFRYSNVAPQWEKFRTFNWRLIENGVRAFVTRRNLNVTVYTGTYGILKLRDDNGDMQKIFLDFDFHTGSRVPVPKIFYKILHDVQNDAGIALIGVNNPYVTLLDIERDYLFCEDVSHRIDWLQWIPDYIPGGYCYACEVNEFNDVIHHHVFDEISNLLV